MAREINEFEDSDEDADPDTSEMDFEINYDDVFFENVRSLD